MTIDYKLDVSSLTVGYNGKPLISDINFSLNKGEILTLIGPNGSGKTTILKSIAKQLSLIAGTVYIDGGDVKKLSGKETAKKMAVVLTEKVNTELTTCFELASAGRYPYTGTLGLLSDKDKKAVYDALERVNALDIADKYVTEISDGQRQRVLLARALCQDPEIIVLDEPTAFLDIRHKTELLGILSNMAKNNGITVVMSLHEIDLAERISDKIVCVKGERITLYGTPAEIFTNENISFLYDIRPGAFNALLGTVELGAPKGEIRCFVIGGNGSGIPFYRFLQRKNVPFAAGILAKNDIDLAVALPLAKKVITSEAFMPISENEKNEAEKIINGVGTVIDCGCAHGEYDRANARLLEYAEKCGKKIIRSLDGLSEADI